MPKVGRTARHSTCLRSYSICGHSAGYKERRFMARADYGHICLVHTETI